MFSRRMYLRLLCMCSIASLLLVLCTVSNLFVFNALNGDVNFINKSTFNDHDDMNE